MASGKLQVLCYKHEIENLRTPEYAGFQLLSLNDYSGQGTALVGVGMLSGKKRPMLMPQSFVVFVLRLSCWHAWTSLYLRTMKPWRPGWRQRILEKFR